MQNISKLPIVVCDVSSRNANVMFELGMRVAFDKAVVLIKDDATPYSFDTGLIEHLPYRKDMRYFETIEFRAKLASKIKHTLDAFEKDPEYSTFLKQFGTFKTTNLKEENLSGQEFLFSGIQEMKYIIEKMTKTFESSPASPSKRRHYNVRDFLVSFSKSSSVAEVSRAMDNLQHFTRSVDGSIDFIGNSQAIITLSNIKNDAIKTMYANNLLAIKGVETVSVST